MKYKDFKILSIDDMKQILGGKSPANETFYGGCTNWSAGSSLDGANTICISLPAGTLCQDTNGQYGNALHCGTPSGEIINVECFHIVI